MSWTLIALAVLAMGPTEEAKADLVVAQAASPPAGDQPSAQTPPAEPSPAQAEAEAAISSFNTPAEAVLRDPFEPFNRAMYSFNNVVDRAALEPVARGYRAITPRFFRTGVRNALQNLGEPVTFANALLQGNLGRAGGTAGRFALNTTFGLLGVLDPAKSVGLDQKNEDFGQTLGVWGVGPGPYLVLPLFGPTTIRDGLGRGVDAGLSPWTYLDGHDMDEIRIGVGVIGAISGREAAIEQIDSLRSTSPDPYVTIRSLYGQARASAIVNGQEDVGQLPDFGDPTGDTTAPQ